MLVTLLPLGRIPSTYPHVLAHLQIAFASNFSSEQKSAIGDSGATKESPIAREEVSKIVEPFFPGVRIGPPTKRLPEHALTVPPWQNGRPMVRGTPSNFCSHVRWKLKIALLYMYVQMTIPNRCPCSSAGYRGEGWIESPRPFVPCCVPHSFFSAWYSLCNVGLSARFFLQLLCATSCFGAIKSRTVIFVRSSF